MSLYVDELFDEISHLPVDAREEALARRCAGHPSVEAEVRALLLAEHPEEPEEPIALVPGAELGRYRLEAPLGTGATASVWKAWDTHLEAWTALKLLHPAGQIRGDRALEAVLHEARAASSIISDHVVRIKTAGRFVGGPHFIEMELCAEHRADADGVEVLEVGRTLSEVGLEGVEEKARAVAEAARGVDAAHRVGVLHRDLKPGNILLTPVSRRAKVTDFGLAADQLYPVPDATTPPESTVTVLLEARDGKVVGTPAYMPPEQAFGHPPSRASDVYALGATLYALLAMQAPYSARDDHPIPALSVLHQVRDDEPVPLRSVAQVPRRLAAIVERAMARSARDRYPTAAALADDLDAWLAGRATSIDGRAPVLRAALAVRRHRGIVSTAAVLCAVLVVFAGALGWLELQRRHLEVSIATARSELAHSRAMAGTAAHVTDLAEAERDRALKEAEVAQEARETALEQESNAERRWKQELATRKSAEEARRVAQEALAVAETTVVQTRDTLATTEATLATATRDLADIRSRLDAETAARETAEGAIRDVRLALNEAELTVQELQVQLARERAARDAAELERDELEGVLAAAREAIGVPEPDPTEEPSL